MEGMFDKCLFVLRNLSSLLERLCALQSRVFDRFFEAAEIAKFTSREFGEHWEKMKDFPQPFTLLSRGVKQYPETDAILVADVTVPDAIVAACRKRTTVPVYTVYDLLEKKP